MEASPTTRYDAQLQHVLAAPADEGRLELIVRRPAEGEREVLDAADLDLDLGLVGDRWAVRDVRTTPIYLAAQLTLINIRMLAAIEPDQRRWPQAGYQLYVDFDLSVDNLPAGSRLAIGSAIIEVSETPHTGCAKFSARFGSEALRWVNSPVGRAHRLRGMNARIVEPGTVRIGDAIYRARGPSPQVRPSSIEHASSWTAPHPSLAHAGRCRRAAHGAARARARAHGG